jgi:hypothetical protein
MGPDYQIILTPSAQKDIKDIYDYLRTTVFVVRVDYGKSDPLRLENLP